MIKNIDFLLEGKKLSDLKTISQDLTEKYKNSSGSNLRLVTKDDEALVYAIVRMPATYSAISFALKEFLTVFDEEISTILDVGAGTGAGAVASLEQLSPKKITCIERETAMIKIGKSLIEDDRIEWINQDIKSIEGLSADLVISSYMLNEMTEDTRHNTIQKLLAMANKALLIVENGTTKGFSIIKKIRNDVINCGKQILSPCPHMSECLNKEWCHFCSRVQRTKAHKYLKDADSAYEDEKFTFLAITNSGLPLENRILRHPYIEKGKISIEVCTKDGIKRKVIKKDNQLYKKVKKLSWGNGY